MTAAKRKRVTGRYGWRYGELEAVPQVGWFLFRRSEVTTSGGILIPRDVGTARAPSRTPNQTIRYTVVDPGEQMYGPGGDLEPTPLRRGDEVLFAHDTRTEYQPKVGHPMLPDDIGYADIRSVAIILRKPETP